MCYNVFITTVDWIVTRIKLCQYYYIVQNCVCGLPSGLVTTLILFCWLFTSMHKSAFSNKRTIKVCVIYFWPCSRICNYRSSKCKTQAKTQGVNSKTQGENLANFTPTSVVRLEHALFSMQVAMFSFFKPNPFSFVVRAWKLSYHSAVTGVLPRHTTSFGWHMIKWDLKWRNENILQRRSPGFGFHARPMESFPTFSNHASKICKLRRGKKANGVLFSFFAGVMQGVK